MVRLNLTSDDVINCKETTAFIKKRNPQFSVYRSTKEPDNFRAVLEKYPKLEVVINLK